jgi:hypothetical protein
MIGYSLWSPEGKQLWSRDSGLDDHADGIMVGNLSGDPNTEPRVYASGKRRRQPAQASARRP